MGGKAGQLSPKEKKFCLEYIKKCEGKAAVIAAGYSVKGAEVTASKLLKKGKVIDEIERLQGKREKKDLMKADEVEAILDAMIRTTVKDLTNDAGIPKPVSELTQEQAYAVESLDVWEKQTKDGGLLSGTSTKTVSKEKLIKTKMQRLGMLVEKVEHSGTINFTDRLEQARKRAIDAVRNRKNKS